MRQPPRPTDGNLAVVLEWLGHGDYQELEAALRICFEEGPPVIEFLIAEADKATTKPLHVYRLLDLTERIGGERGPGEDRHLRAACSTGPWRFARRPKTCSTCCPRSERANRPPECSVRSGGVEMAMVAAARRSLRTRTSTRGAARANSPLLVSPDRPRRIAPLFCPGKLAESLVCPTLRYQPLLLAPR